MWGERPRNAGYLDFLIVAGNSKFYVKSEYFFYRLTKKEKSMLSMHKQNISKDQNRPVDCQRATSDSKEQDLKIGFLKCVLTKFLCICISDQSMNRLEKNHEFKV